MADAPDGATEIELLARAARRKLVPVLATLQRRSTPLSVRPATPHVAAAMQSLIDFERQPSRPALQEALRVLRAGLGVLQAAPPGFEAVTGQLAESLEMAHTLAERGLPRTATQLASTTALDMTRKSAGVSSRPPKGSKTLLEGQLSEADLRPTLKDSRHDPEMHPLAEFMDGEAASDVGAPSSAAPRTRVDTTLATHSDSNFYLGLDGGDVVDDGGLFVATYQLLDVGTPLLLRVSLPGGYEFEAWAVVRWQRPPHSDHPTGLRAAPGYGVKFTRIEERSRELVHRYTKNRQPLLYEGQAG
jgi:hypothetical protein